ncbi:MAG: hypothetical protein CMM91_08965 [Rickettsiales bacterium]|nr:hypothetical protein [Rickettsiales bacterium]OUV53169.1 MAG: hypothetical protein CBC87_04680 [Rickettsiales bacterium TMED127]
MHSKILKLQKEMKKNHMDGYILPCTDEYLNEYVPNVKNRLKWLTNFTGSNGICFILRRKLLFFTDGRYILQSKKELSEKFNIFDTSKINIFDWVTKNIKEKKFKISVDMKINSIFFIEKLIDVFKETNNKLILNKNNFIDNIFNNIENEKSKNLFFLSERYSGEKATSKIKRIKEILKDYDLVIFTSPESIAWLLNIRGGDLEHTPLVFCRLLIKKNKLILFINKKKNK